MYRIAPQVRVVREIGEGEELLVRYWGAHEFASREERRSGLSPWNFSCACEVCALTGVELMANERTRKKIRELHAAIDATFHSGLPNQAYEAAKEKVKEMMSIENEVVVELPAALMECCEMAAFCEMPSSSTASLMKTAKDMSELFGANHLNLYWKYSKSNIFI